MQELQELVSKLQGYINYDTLDKIVGSYNSLSEDDKKAVMDTLEYWVKKVELLNEYEAKRTSAIKNGLSEMNKIQEKTKNDYRDAVVKIENQENISSNEEAENLIKQI